MARIDWTLQALRTFPATLARALDDVPHDALDWRPASWDGIPSESLTIRQQICHLRDIEADGYLVRLRRVLTQTDPQLESLDTYALVESRSYDRSDLRQSLESFTDARAQTMRLLDAVKPADLSRRGEFEGYGPVTLLGLIHYLCSHDQQHLAGIQWLLGQHAAIRAA